MKRNKVAYTIDGEVKYGNTICPICGEKKLKLPNDLNPQSMWGRRRRPRICQDCYDEQVREDRFSRSEEGFEQSKREWRQGKLILIFPKDVSDMTKRLKDVMESKNMSKEEAIEYIKNVCGADKAVIVHNADELMEHIL